MKDETESRVNKECESEVMMEEMAYEESFKQDVMVKVRS